MKRKAPKLKKKTVEAAESAAYEHRIFKVFEGDLEPESGYFDLNSERTSHVFMEDLQDVMDEMQFLNWHFNFGFALDKKTIYITYRKMKNNASRNR